MNETKNDPTIKYALYCRKSTEDSSRQILSLDSQEKEMTTRAKDLGLDIVKVFPRERLVWTWQNRGHEMIENMENKFIRRLNTMEKR